MAMKKLGSTLLAMSLLCAAPLLAAPQGHERIRETALSYAQAQTRALPGKVSIQIGEIDPRTVLRACTALEAFTPSG
jgi:flagella basal body P-ring formation protein FlgA